MVCEGTKIRPLWSMVTEFVTDKLALPNICSSLRCLLEIFEQEELDVYSQLFLRILYFGVWKLIGRRWISMEKLTLGMWMKVINDDILLYLMTYEARGLGRCVIVGWTPQTLWRERCIIEKD